MNAFLYFLAGAIVGFVAGHSFLDRKQLLLIHKKLNMAQETLAELKALAQRANTALDAQSTAISNIAADIQRIKDGLPTSGGLSAAEVAELKTDLDSVATKAEAVASAATSLDQENEPEEPPTT